MRLFDIGNLIREKLREKRLRKEERREAEAATIHDEDANLYHGSGAENEADEELFDAHERGMVAARNAVHERLTEERALMRIEDALGSFTEDWSPKALLEAAKHEKGLSC